MKCQIVTPERTVFSGEVDSIQHPAYDGLAGILPHHAPMIGKLGTGTLKLRTKEGEKRFQLSGGFYQVEKDFNWQITVARGARRKKEHGIFFADGVGLFYFMEKCGGVGEL